ncbi:riboflavin biosynthesis protein RibF [Alloacidobacterium dinghuense]|uniref:Riboflavin biosynthesis protein n=1 Tax=Alloacidobacterium dinghuense TaxID=2763107 RepID=A0A7G8BCZ4_9BACT|nr:riboflavin biosynthesis protein RibF [Alloacidobacterium dinghuense]QNI30414.1 riboflavin biosynthesis protein RibF [Alloacidobacterium dinghuense]
MRVFRSLDQLPAGYGPTVIAIGNFDGVHCGHRWIIEHARSRARDLNAKCIAVTFDPHPVRVLRPDVAPRLITTMPERLRLLAETGLDATVVLPFTEEFSHLPAEVFARDVLRQGLHAVEVHEGDSFRFGYQAQAGIHELIALGHEYGFTVAAHHLRTVRGFPVSSSQIRQRVAAGDMTAARALLGRPFSILSKPARGRGIGAEQTVPTINLAPYRELLPAIGVYITRMKIGEGPAALTFNSVTNAGNRPTFGADSFAVESHLLDFHPVPLTEETPLELTFLKRIREEKRFPSPGALKAQILRDVAYAMRYFHLMQVLSTAKNAKS